MSQLNSPEIFRFLWLIPPLLSVLGLFLSLWIIIPSPTYFLLALAVGMPELTPWLIALNAIALILIIFLDQSWLSSLFLICSLLGLLLSLLPLIQLPSNNRKFAMEMERALGTNYLQAIPQYLQYKMRPGPFVLADVFRGIRTKEVRIQRGIIFASRDQVDLKLNLYQPLLKGSYPTLVIIYGGAWREGSPDKDETFSCYMAAQGYSVIAIDYRHAPQYQFPTQLEDIKTAFQYIRDHADNLEIDIERIAVMGRSAGGHLATLITYQQNIIPFKAVVSYYAPANLTEEFYDPPFPNPLNTQAVLCNFLGGTPEELPEVYQQASPKSYVKSNLPPSLLIYGSKDHIVQAKVGQGLWSELCKNDNRAIYLEIPWAEHAFDAIFSGVSNQLALYYTERFLAFMLYPQDNL